MSFQFEVGARVVPKEIPRTEYIGTVVDRLHKRVGNFYLVELQTEAGVIYGSIAEGNLARKIDG